MAYLTGVDVSAVQGKVDWELVRASGRSFAIAKVSEGDSGRDPTGPANLAGIRAAGMACGAYHFAHLNGDPIRQAQLLWSACGDAMPDLPPALDLEEAPAGMSAAAIVSWAEAFVGEAARLFGRHPHIYTFPFFWRTRLLPAAGASVVLASCPLWMADYSGGESPKDGWKPFVPPPWHDWTLAQTSGNNSSRVPGICCAVDHDVLCGGSEELRDLCGLPPAAPDSGRPTPVPFAAPDVPGPDDDGDDDPGPKAA